VPEYTNVDLPEPDMTQVVAEHAAEVAADPGTPAEQPTDAQSTVMQRLTHDGKMWQLKMGADEVREWREWQTNKDQPKRAGGSVPEGLAQALQLLQGQQLKQADSFAAALARFQAELPSVLKGRTGKVMKDGKLQYEYDYADLADVSSVVLPALGKQGLSFTAAPVMTDRGYTLIGRLQHVSGQYVEGTWPLPANVAPQSLGIWLTYGRRYLLCALSGVAADADTDAADQPAPAAKPRTRKVEGSAEAQVTAIAAEAQKFAEAAKDCNNVEDLKRLYDSASTNKLLRVLVDLDGRNEVLSAVINRRKSELEG